MMYRVGYAMEAKKVKTFMLPSLVEQAERKGLHLVPVDPTRPLSEQGHFHCILHKLYCPLWTQHLLSFAGAPIIDPPHRIHLLRSRASMLDSVSRIRIPFDVGVPKQRLLHDDCSDLRFPVIAKPLSAEGSADSHDMLLLLSPDGLRSLPTKTPMVLQEFVNHGGVLFKLYVVGDHVCCVKRSSLPDVSDADSHNCVVPFSRISNSAVVQEDGGDLDGELAEQLTAALRRELGLRLFNVDVIRSSSDPNKYYVIDINYFPGYAKMPNYEHVFTDFLLDVSRNHPTTTTSTTTEM